MTEASRDPPGVLAPGTQLDGFRILAFLGKGGMGSVYRARDEALARDVALKVIRAEKRDPQNEARFAREMEAASKIAHPNIVRVHASGTALGLPYIVTDFVEGETLDALVRRQGRLDPRRAATYGAKLGRALAALHAAGIIHRDVKPANVLVDETGEPRLTDFGLAKLEGAGSLTETHQLLGTPPYAAPEQLAGQEVDARVDVYGLGATVYELVSGGPPFRGENLAALVIAKMKAPALPVPPGPLEAAIRIVCLRCLLPDANLRWASTAEVADELERAIGPAPRRARPRSPLGALALGLAALASLFLMRHQGGESKSSPVAPVVSRGAPPRPGADREDLALADHFGAETARFGQQKTWRLLGQPREAARILGVFLEFAGRFSEGARTQPVVLARVRTDDVDRLLAEIDPLLRNNPIDTRTADETGLDLTRARRLPVEGWRRGTLLALLSRVKPTSRERCVGADDLDAPHFSGAPAEWALVFHTMLLERQWDWGPIGRDALVAAVTSALAESRLVSRPPADWSITMRKAAQLLALIAASEEGRDAGIPALAHEALDSAFAMSVTIDDVWRLKQELARLLLVEGRDAEARAKLDEALRDREGMEPARKKEDELAGLRALRMVAAASAHQADAKALIAREMDAQPDRVDAWIARALVFADEGRFDEALEQLAAAERKVAVDTTAKLTILPVAHYRARILAQRGGR